jgi:hypothetical protein
VVADIPPHCRLFNTDTLGGFVILERPDVPVSLDTRNDLYSRQRVFAEEQVLSGEDDVTSGLAGAGVCARSPGKRARQVAPREPGVGTEGR